MLNNRIRGYYLVSCFSQEKDELILVFSGNDHHEFFIRAHLRTVFSCISFPESFARSHKNTIDLLPVLEGRSVIETITYRFERLLQIRLSEGFDLIFKMFGSQSNILLFEDNKCIDQFKKNKKGDREFSLDAFKTEQDLSFERFRQYENTPRKFIPAFDKNVLEYLDRNNYDRLDINEKYKMICGFLTDLENPVTYYIIDKNNIPGFTLFKPDDGSCSSYRDIKIALNQFYKTRIHQAQLLSEKKRIITSLSKAIEKAEKYIGSATMKLEEIRKHMNYKQIADNLMANLNSIPGGIEKVKITDLYSGKPIEIKLKAGLSTQKNAELYYRKSKNQDIEINTLKSAIEAKKILIFELKKRLDEVQKIRDIRELRKNSLIAELKTTGNKKKQPSAFREFTFQGFRILVGKSSGNNDQLTFGEGYKEDLWMHARDVPGSHVLIKYQSGKVFPQPVIERAAELAAYFSKNRNNSLCPVIYTPRKFVRKRKGTPPGQVIVEKEEIIMVRPRL